MGGSSTLTFVPGIMLLSSGIVISRRLLDSSKGTLNGPCALLLKASASSATASDQDANLDIPVALPTQQAMCLLSAFDLSDNRAKELET
jgi:hypothetical protein